MNQPPPQSNDVIEVRPLGNGLSTAKTVVLMKSATLELIRLVVPAGKRIPEHRARGEITVHCLEGRVAFTSGETTRDLEAGHLVHLPPGVLHALAGIEDASLLVTIMLR